MKDRVIFLDYLRIIAIFMVLIIHACELYYFGEDGSFFINSASDARWLTAIDSACRAAVPLFVIASAYLLFPIKRSTGDFLKRRLLRVGIPFIIWSFIYTWRFNGNYSALLINFPMTTGGHLWFVPMLVGIYLLMPLLSPWAERVSERELRFWLLAWLFTTLFPFLRHLKPYMWGECPWNSFGTFHYVSGFIGYMLLGFYFRKFASEWSWCRTLKVALPLLTFGWIIVVSGFFFRIPDAGGYPVSAPYALAVDLEMSWEYCSLGVVMTVLGYFLIIRKLTYCGWFYSHLVRPLSEASFGVYLIHILFLSAMAPYFKFHLNTPIAIITLATIVFILSSSIAFIIRKLPLIGKWICG